MNNNESKKRPPKKGPNAIAEKPKNFSAAIKKLFIYLKELMPLVIIAFILAITSSVFSIIGPNKLRDLTDELSKGLVVNEQNIKLIAKALEDDFNEEKMADINKEILNIKLDEETIYLVNSSSINNEDKVAFNGALATINSENMISVISSLPSSVLKIILPESTIGNVCISSEDKIKYINVISKLTKDNMKSMINEIPSSIQKVLLPDCNIKGLSLETEDKVAFINIMDYNDEKVDVNKLYKGIDKLPVDVRNFVKPKINTNLIYSICLFLLILYLISALFNFIQSYIMATVSNKFSMNLRTMISKKINKLPLKYFDKHSTGDILSRVTNDVDTIGTTMSESLGSLIGAIALFIGSIIMMFATNWIMAITAIVSSLIGFAFMAMVLGKSQKYFIARQKELGKLNGHIEEIYSSHNVVKAYNGNKDASDKFDKLNANVFECNFKSQFLSGLMPAMMGFVGNFGYVMVCIVGALLVVNNSITFGVIIAFMIYVRLFTSPLSQIAQGATSMQSTAAAAERVFEFVSEEEMNDESSLKTKLLSNKVKGNIVFKHVKFGYDEKKTIIKDFNCTVKPGQKIAIVGPTGAGKTTMVNLLMKFYAIKDGDIFIDGVSTKELTRENIHKLFVMVLQDTWLFNGTIKENIIYNQKNISDKKVEEACKVVGLDHFIKTLPNGYNTVLSDTESISAGQKQLLTIARGMLEDGPFLILDEATSSVDTRTEELVQKAMDKLTEGKTSFIIAHRLSTIKNADLILVMKDGNIIEQGSHKSLMKNNGFYAELYNSQFKN